jgi:hypothetical protein
MALSLDGAELLSRALLALAAALWIGVVAIAADRLIHARARLRAEARTPAALTLVAGTAVLGSRLQRLGWDLPAGVALAAAAVVWAALVPRVLRTWSRPTIGVSFVLVVATESLAVLAANAAIVERQAWLAFAAVVFLLLGLGAYAFVLASFDLRQVHAGRGDQWVAGGALAIATVACDRTASAAAALPPLHALHGLLAGGAVVLWVAAVAWLPLLLVSELTGGGTTRAAGRRSSRSACTRCAASAPARRPPSACP